MSKINLIKNALEMAYGQNHWSDAEFEILRDALDAADALKAKEPMPFKPADEATLIGDEEYRIASQGVYVGTGFYYEPLRVFSGTKPNGIHFTISLSEVSHVAHNPKPQPIIK